MFVPEGFEPPRGLVTDRFTLEPLGPEHNERDHVAWSSSIDHIRSSPGYGHGSSWPHEMSLAENLADLEWHARDFAARSGFTYSVVAPEGDVVGCVYLYPARDEFHDVHVHSWVREPHAELDLPLREAVVGWLVDSWPFERPLYEPLLD